MSARCNSDLTYMISTWSQSAPCLIVLEHAAPRSAKSAERMEGAMIALGAIVSDCILLVKSGLLFTL